MCKIEPGTHCKVLRRYERCTIQFAGWLFESPVNFIIFTAVRVKLLYWLTPNYFLWWNLVKMIVFKYLLIGALHRQRGDRSNIYLSRALFWLSLSTSLYITSAAHMLFQPQFEAFSKMKGEGLFSLKSFDGSFLMAGLLTIALMVTFFFVYGPPLVEEFKENKRKGMWYRIFLLYFLPSFVVFALTRNYGITGRW